MESKHEFVVKVRELVKTWPRPIFVVMRYLFAFLQHLSMSRYQYFTSALCTSIMKLIKCFITAMKTWWIRITWPYVSAPPWSPYPQTEIKSSTRILSMSSLRTSSFSMRISFLMMDLALYMRNTFQMNQILLGRLMMVIGMLVDFTLFQRIWQWWLCTSTRWWRWARGHGWR